MAYTPKPNREVRGGKAMVSASELADFKKQYGEDKTLRDLLNMDKGLTRRKEEASPEARQNAKEGMSMTRMDPEKGAEAKKKFDLENARDMALARAEGERAVAAHKAKQARQKEADEAASMGTDFKRGGKVSSASRRADGIATKGKTRGRIC